MCTIFCFSPQLMKPLNWRCTPLFKNRKLFQEFRVKHESLLEPFTKGLNKTSLRQLYYILYLINKPIEHHKFIKETETKPSFNKKRTHSLIKSPQLLASHRTTMTVHQPYSSVYINSLLHRLLRLLRPLRRQISAYKHFSSAGKACINASQAPERCF